MDDRHQDETLWKLLGQARRPEAPPFFAARVLRAIEQRDVRPVPLWRAWLLRWAPLGVVGALALAVLLPQPPAAAPAPALASVRSAAFLTTSTAEIAEVLPTTDYVLLRTMGELNDHDEFVFFAGLAY